MCVFNRWSSCATDLWTGVKIAGLVSLGVVICAGVITWVSLESSSPDPDFECCMKILELLERFEEI